MYQIRYSQNFADSLTKTVDYWEKQLQLPANSIKKYVSLISKNINLLADYPYISEDISHLYHFTMPTYRITIGNQYCIFYRVDEKNKVVQIGSLYNSHQMKVEF